GPVPPPEPPPRGTSAFRPLPGDEAVRVGADGTRLWRSRFEPEASEVFGHRPGCELSPDGRVLWVHRPDAMAGRGRPAA
ncbi:hypothetical protein ACIQOV_30175, partial [Kitasatospora sp. NPDC091257]